MHLVTFSKSEEKSLITDFFFLKTRKWRLSVDNTFSDFFSIKSRIS